MITKCNNINGLITQITQNVYSDDTERNMRKYYLLRTTYFHRNKKCKDYL